MMKVVRMSLRHMTEYENSLLFAVSLYGRFDNCQCLLVYKARISGMHVLTYTKY